jgi:long-chain acyl-CoA synthetase
LAHELLGSPQFGAIICPLNPNLKEELPHICKLLKPKLILVDSETIEREKIKSVVLFGEQTIELSQLLSPPRKARASLSLPKINPQDLAFILFTSGTMGNPKGVMLSHENITSNVSAILRRINFSSQDNLLSIAPWTHVMGLTCTLILPASVGATTLYTDAYEQLRHIFKRNQVTIFLGVPKLYRVMLKALQKKFHFTEEKGRIRKKGVGFFFRKLVLGTQFRFFVSESAPLDEHIFDAYRALGLEIAEGYGLSETAPVLTFNTPEREPSECKAGSVGRALSNISLELETDPSRWPEDVGEIVVKGPNIFQGYYKNPTETAKVFDQEGWFHTGDLAKMDEDENIYIKGRAKNIIVLESGETIYAEEVEKELQRQDIPYVEDFFIRAGGKKGREIVEIIVKPDIPALESAGINKPRWRGIISDKINEASRGLAPFKQPKSLILVEEIPKTATQDIKRREDLSKLIIS